MKKYTKYIMAIFAAIALCQVMAVANGPNHVVGAEKLAPGETEVLYEITDDPLYPRPEGIAVDPRGNLFVSVRATNGDYYEKNEIIKITPNGESAILADLGQAEENFSGILGLTTDRIGNVYAAFVSGNANHGVWMILPNGDTVHLNGSENIIFPNALTFDDRGNLYVTDCDRDGPGLVWRYGISGEFEVWASGDPLDPDPGTPFPNNPSPGANGIAFDPPNRVYVANNEKSLILQILVLPDGEAGEITIVAGAWPPQGPPGLLMAPDGLALDTKGNLYSAVPAVGLASPLELSPVIMINPSTGEVTAVVDPYVYAGGPPPFDYDFDYPTSLVFGAGPLDKKSLFVVSGTVGMRLASGQVITQVGVGVPGRTGQ